MLSVFITPCAQPTACHRAINLAVRSTTWANNAACCPGLSEVRVMMVDDVVGQDSEMFVLAPIIEDLEGAESDM